MFVFSSSLAWRLRGQLDNRFLPATSSQLMRVIRKRPTDAFDVVEHVVLAEQSLILSEAKAPQPDHDVHGGARNSGLPHIIVQPGESVQDARKLRGPEGRQTLKTIRVRASKAEPPEQGCFEHMASIFRGFRQGVHAPKKVRPRQ